MFPPLPQKKAASVLKDVVHFLDSGCARLVQVSRPSEERKNQGVMLGVLVCRNSDGNEVSLVTNSGNAKKLLCDDFCNMVVVPPIASNEEIERALSDNDRKIHEITEKLESAQNQQPSILTDSDLQHLRKQRDLLCARSLEKVYDLYNFHCIDSKIRSLKEICSEYNGGKLPPTGTGDCCAPKLFDYAFANNLVPLSLAETAYPVVSGGTGSAACVKTDLLLTSPCDERCGILLPAMLGLRILYRDDSICVVNKQSGLLSVPGRGEDKQDCIESRFRRLFPESVEIKQPAVHRLDMETSGVMILAFTQSAHRELNRQFEAKEVQKEYVALLDGVLPKLGISQHGEMELFFRLDIDNRPHQIWDRENGKSAITEWKILGVERYHAPDGTTRNATRVLFLPHTGRTHQLRLASADSHGFGVPIIGDTLYGHCDNGERLMLHARKVIFTHPVTGERMTIECAPEF